MTAPSERGSVGVIPNRRLRAALAIAIAAAKPAKSPIRTGCMPFANTPAHHVGSHGAQGDAQSDIARPARYGIADNAIDADGAEQKRDETK